MSEQTRTKLIAGFLVLAVIWAGCNFKSDDSKPTEKVPQTIQPINAGLNSSIKSNSFIDIEIYESDSWGRSPFYLASLSSIQSTASKSYDTNVLSWILSGIMYSNNSPTAIINKRPVKIGEIVDKAIVTQIDKEKVIIKYNHKEITLTVSKG